MSFLFRPKILATMASIALLGFGTGGPAEAGVQQWTASGPPGAAVTELAVDPATPTTIYMIGHGVWKSTDAGASWVRLTSGVSSTGFRALVLNPDDPSVVLAGTWDAGVFRSTNGGASWTASSQGLPAVGVLCLAFDPVTPSTVYAGLNRNGVSRSTDGGRTWSPLNNGIDAGVTVTTFAIDPTAPQRIFAGTYDGMIRTVDGGSSWSPVAGGLPSDSLQTVVFDPTSSAVIYVGMEGRSVYKSTDGGTTWLPAATGLASDLVVECLAFDPDSPSTLYLASDGQGMFKSTDGAASWSPAGNGLQSVTFNHVAAAATSPPAIYAGSYGQGVFKSTDSGASWQPANSGLDASRATAVVADEHVAGRLWAATLGGVWRSDDGGAGWASLNTGLPFVQVADLARDAVDGDTFYAATWRGLHKTTDGGASWVRAENDPALSSYEAVATHPTTADRVFAGKWSGLWVSENGGETWTQPDTGPKGARVLSFAFDPTNSSTVYSGAWKGIFRSHDGGATWSSSLGDESIWSIAVDPVSPSNVYVCSYNGVFKSTDGGATWSPASAGITARYCWAVAVDPGLPATIYAGTNAGVFRSTNGGTSWAPFPGLEEYDIRNLTFSADRNTLYAATTDGGVASYSFSTPSCSLGCSARVPGSTRVGAEVYFQATATASGCTASPSFEWDFGDGSVHSSAQNPSHWYAAAVNRTWSLTARADGASCSRSGTITVEERAATWFVPAAAHAPGAEGTSWRTDLAAVNRGPGVAALTLTFIPYDGGAQIQRTFTLAAGASVEWRDVLVSLFGLGPTSATKGTIRIDSANPVFVTARTYNQAAAGTFGQYLPALPAVSVGSQTASTEAVLTHSSQLGVIPHLKKGAGFRSNLGVQNLGTTPVSVAIRLFGASGGQLGSTITQTVPVGRYWQQDDVFAAAGAGNPTIAYATVEVTSVSGAAWFYGSVVDNATGDPTTIPVLVPAHGDREIAGIAHAPGAGGTAWRTDVAAVYLGSAPIQLQPRFTTYEGGPSYSAAASVPASGTVEWRDVLVSLFGRDQAGALKGTMWLGTMSDLYVTARTYNQTASGTFGQYLPALTAAEGLGKMVVAVIPQLKKSQAFRSNLGVLNLSPFDIVAVVRLWDRNGDQLGSTWNPNVRAHEYFQRDDVFAALGAGSSDLAYATVEVLTTGGRIWAYGSVVDNATGDPTTVPALVP